MKAMNKNRKRKQLGYFFHIFVDQSSTVKFAPVCHLSGVKREVTAFFREMRFNKLIAMNGDFYSQ